MVLTPVTWWERACIAIIVVVAIVTGAMLIRDSALSAILAGLTPLAGLGLVYQNKASTPTLRGALLGWIAVIQATFVHLTGI